MTAARTIGHGAGWVPRRRVENQSSGAGGPGDSSRTSIGALGTAGTREALRVTEDSASSRPAPNGHAISASGPLRHPSSCRSYSPQGSRECAVKLTTLSPRGRASRALDEAESPTSPAGWLLTNRAKQFARSGFAAPSAEGATAPKTPKLATSAQVTRRRIELLLCKYTQGSWPTTRTVPHQANPGNIPQPCEVAGARRPTAPAQTSPTPTARRPRGPRRDRSTWSCG